MSNVGGRPKTAIEQLASRGFDDHPLVTAFREDMILHSRFQDALDQLAERMQYGEQQSITAVLGPTGSGKTALATEFGYQFSEAMKMEPESNQSTLLCMELAAPEQGTFKWKDDLYVPALNALCEPCTTKKINVAGIRVRLERGDNRSAYSGRQQLTAAEMRNLFYAALERARVRGVVLDEANHLRRPTSKGGVFAQYDSLKSRSNACRAHFALLGTTEMADIFLQSGPISKRVYPIWLSPYRPDEKRLFGSAVQAIVEKLPIRITFIIEAKLDELFEGALGLYGLVHEWFDRVLVRAIRSGRDRITWADMISMRLEPIQLVGVARDLIKYREVMSGPRPYLKQQMASLFLPLGVDITREIDPPLSEKRRGAKAPKPGQRKLGRDPVEA